MDSPSRLRARELARSIVALGRRPALIAVDGVDGSGKTTFSAHLAQAIGDAGRPAVLVHEDDFLAPRAVRYRLGRDSPEGFFRDSYDLDALVTQVLDPLRPGADRRIRRRVFDLATDQPADAPREQVDEDAVVIVEGMFLHRDELVDRWDWSLFLDVPFTETARRMAHRDGSHPDPEHPTMRRYIQGQRIYLARCDPRARATVVMDTPDPAIAGRGREPDAATTPDQDHEGGQPRVRQRLT